MHNLIKHIAHFLLMVLLFPIVYQGIHMVHHHHDITHSIQPVDSGLNQTIHNEICFVGEFEFTNFDVVTSLLISETLTQRGEIIQIPYQYNPCRFNGYNIALRAPPFIG